jgi:hypothetical protein
MYAVIGRVKIKPGHEDQTLAMVQEHGVAMLRGIAESARGYWSRCMEDDDTTSCSTRSGSSTPRSTHERRKQPSTRSASFPKRPRHSSGSMCAR